MFTWNEKNFERAKKLYKQGVRTSLIAQELGTTRNAILGKMYRNKLSTKSTSTRRHTRHSYATHFKSMGNLNVYCVIKLIQRIQSLIGFVAHVSQEIFIVAQFDIRLNH